MAIINLSSIDQLQQSDQVAIGSNSLGDDRRAPLSLLSDFINSSVTGNFGSYTTQYDSPQATGFSVAVTDGSSNNNNIHLILTPLALFADGTFVLPDVAFLVDKQDLLFNTTQEVTILVVDGNGATVIGAPTTLKPNDFFRLKYDKTLTTWYRVG